MSRVLILVEGQTERAIVDRVIAPALAVKSVYLFPRVVGKPGHKGGNRFSKVRSELKALIHQEPGCTVTMLFDYYGLQDDWPGLNNTKGINPSNIPDIIEAAIAEAILKDLGHSIYPTVFIPYIQMHEIESLLFAGPDEMAEVFGNARLAPQIKKIVRDYGGCEYIDDDPQNAPSKRIERIFPAYRKGSGVNAHAYRIAQRIGLEKIRRNCPHFNQWLATLEQGA